MNFFQRLAEIGDPAEDVRFNLGSGDIPIAGYINLDGSKGDCIFPLHAVDAAEIRASHVLEHFPHRQSMDVLRDWVAALKPGGVLKIAVPDFKILAQAYIDGKPVNPEPYVMGAQIDERDFHKAIFDEENLREMMRAAGLRGITRWKSDIKDCAALPISLNLQGYKPLHKFPKVVAVMSAPRLGFMDNHRSLLLLQKYNVPVLIARGAYWGPCLTRGMEEALESNPDYIMTLDYDSIFGGNQIEALVELAARAPHIDALTAVQVNRHTSKPLFVFKERDEAVAQAHRSMFDAETLKVHSAHFGMTLIRADKLRALPRPWFYGNPDSEGRWGDGRLDDDISFWHNWDKAGYNLHVALRVPIGHLIEKVMWPDINLEPSYQDPTEFWTSGPPENVWQ